MPARKKILLVAYSFHPLQDPQALRWFYLSNTLAEQGFEIDALSIRVPHGFNAGGLRLHPAINVIRTFPGILEHISNKIKAGMAIYQPGHLEIRKRKKFQLLKGGYWIVRKTFNHLLIGDYRTEWMPFCLHALRRLNLKNYDVVITSQEPVVDSLIGLYVKKRNPDLPWIADMGDLMSAPYYPAWRRRLDGRVEGKIMRHADKIVVTNRGAKDEITATHRIEAGKIAVVPQGFRLRDCLKRKVRKNHVFTLAFTGTFYENFRDPTYLIDALSEVGIKYRFIIAARTDAFMETFKRIEKNISFLGLIPHSESLKAQERADVLIHFGNKQMTQVPGKFYEYLGALKPILTIVYDPRDETAVLTRRLNVGMACLNEKEEIKNTILRLYRYWEDGTTERYLDLDCDKLKTYSWEARASQIARLIMELPRQYSEKSGDG